jgi:hypothetical protein
MKYSIINLNSYKAPGSKVFTGRDRGQYVREKSQIDQLSKGENPIEVIIPEDIYSINPSFLEEFLVNVVQRIGKTAFFDKFKITNKGEYKIDKDLDEAIDRILRQDHALI